MPVPQLLQLVLLAALAVTTSCKRKSNAPTAAPPADAAAPAIGTAASAPPILGEVIDAHVHLTTGSTSDLLAAMDRHGIQRAVILSSPHLDPATAGAGPPLSHSREANEVVLAAARAHPDRFIPFLTLDIDEPDLDYLRAALDGGACGVKIYQGHRSLRRLPLDHEQHHPLFQMLADRGTPVLLHVNTVRFRDELTGVMRAFPHLDTVCAHLCGSRTDLDRLIGILRDFPRLMVDTSHGAGTHGAAGFENLDRERDRLRSLIEAEPERFLFGSDLVTAGPERIREQDWDLQLAANLGLIMAERFRFWRKTGDDPAMTIQDYRGLSLTGRARAQVLAGNAHRWLASCLRP